MKKSLAILSCSLFLQIQAFEYEKQFENDQIIIERAKLGPHEETPLHRDEYPHIVIALQGGTITRLEADGSTTDVHFPTGKSIFRKTDPVNELHSRINNSSEPIELIIIQLKNECPVNTKPDENTKEIAIQIKINCSESSELNDFTNSIPTSGEYSSTFEEWKTSFINNMTQLIRLVDSEKVYNTFWSVSVNEHQPNEAQP